MPCQEMSLLIVLTFCSLQTLNETIISVGEKEKLQKHHYELYT